MKRTLLLLLVILACGLLKAAATDTQTGSNSQKNTTNKPASATDAGFVVPAKDTGLTDRVVYWYYDHLNYGAITLLMGIESSFIPFPSEVVVPPAAWKACDEESSIHPTRHKWLNIVIVVLFATLGALIGALINYYLSFFLGRPIVYWFADSKLGHLLLLSKEKIVKAEHYFVEHGNSSTFIGRFVPGIRQLISIPAGLAKMPILPFIGYTALGAGIWNAILAIIGYVLHGNKALIEEYYVYIKWGLLLVGVLFVAYLIYKGLKNRKKQSQNAE